MSEENRNEMGALNMRHYKPVVLGGHARPRVQLECEPFQGETQQHLKDEVNINNIVKKFQAGVDITHVNPQEPMYGDANATTFTEAMMLVTAATETFNQLPSEVRAHFQNDPAQYLDAMSDLNKIDTPTAQVLHDAGIIQIEHKKPETKAETLPAAEPKTDNPTED